MAVWFMLAVRYPAGSVAAHDVEPLVDRTGITVRGVPWSARVHVGHPRGYREVTVAVPGLGSHGPYPPGVDHRSLVRDDVTAVGHQLYAILRQLDGYEMAIVGYDPEELVDLETARADLAELDEPVPGLVVNEGIRDELGWTGRMEPFAPGAWWVPYRGDRGYGEGR